MVDNIGKFIDDNKQFAEDIKNHSQLRNKLLDKNDFTIASNPKKIYTPPDRLKEVPSFDFKPLDDAFDRLANSAWNYEKALSNYKKGSLSAEKKSELNDLLKDVDQAFTSEKGLPRRDWFKNMIYAPGYYTGYGVKTLPGVREGLEERKWNEVKDYIQEVAKALDRAAAKINSAAKLLTKIQ